MSILAAGFPGASLAAAGGRHALQAPVAQQIDQLHTIVLVACLAIPVVVFAIMFCSLVRHRRPPKREAGPFHANILVELAWSAIPLLIAGSAAYPATRTLIERMDPANAPAAKETHPPRASRVAAPPIL